MKHVIALLSLLALLGACAPPTDGKLEVLAAAPDATAEAGTARVSMDMTMEIAGDRPMRTRVRGEGVADVSRRLASMSVKVQAAQGAQTATHSLQMLADGTAVYLRVPEGFPGFDAPTEWVRMEPATGSDPNALGQGSPTDGLALLRGAEEVEEIGPEEIRETPTTHYRVVIDPRRALERAPQANRKAVENQLRAIDSESMPVDVWIDEEGRVRRQSFSSEGGQEGLGFTMTMTFDMYDFGVPAEIELPDPADVTDMPMPGSAPAP